MIIFNLQEEFDILLPQAEEVYIAVALAKKSAIEDNFDLIPETATVRLIVGVDLPTTVEALESIKALTKSRADFAAGICYDNTTTFHPKVYIIKSGALFTAFLGSANFTDGGLQNNVELTYKITDQSNIAALLAWFNECFSRSYPIDDHNIDQYRKNRTVTKNPPKSKLPFIRPALSPDEKMLEGIDFTTRYFKKEEHLAFKSDNYYKNTPDIVAERQKTENRFRLLDEEIRPLFSQYGLDNIYPNVDMHLVSMSQSNKEAPRKINAMWLSYGKSQPEIKKYQAIFANDNDAKKLQTFIHHARLQIRVELAGIGVWILFGKKNGSSFDRDFFRDQMTSAVYRQKFYDLCKALPPEYFIKINEIPRHFNFFPDADALHDFCKKDNMNTYFIIGRDYMITDDEMSETELPLTVLEEFQRMYPIYRMMKRNL